MHVQSLAIWLGNIFVGHLFRIETGGASPVMRFVADSEFARLQDAPCLSLSMMDTPETQAAVWADTGNPLFNGNESTRYGTLLPAFFQNMLPEGVFRDQVAALRGCQAFDHFEMLAACGIDLPGAVRAIPGKLSQDEVARLLMNNREPIEVEIVSSPMDDGVSLSGFQPKLGVLKVGDRYVGRTKLSDTHIIAKLPVVGYGKMPEVEDLSLRLAAIAGVTTCHAELVPLERLEVEHHYDLGDSDNQTKFLAVTRFDRSPAGRIHCEDFAQIMGIQPEAKYSTSYLTVARLMMDTPSLGESAVHELLRRMLVNELVGNPDMHLKNIGVQYRDGRTPELSPAYDVVAYAAFNARSGHALHILPPSVDLKPRIRAPVPGAALAGKPLLTPVVLREFCATLGIPEKPAEKALRDTAAKAVAHWPKMIAESGLTDHQKGRLERHLESNDKFQAASKRVPKRSAGMSL